MLKIERILRNTLPVRFVVAKSKKIILPGFQGVPLYDVVKFFLDQLNKTSLTERAAAVSYNFIMAIPPICLFLFSLIPHLPFVKKNSIKNQLANLIRDIVPAKEHNVNLINFVESFFKDPKIGLLSFGFILLIFFGSNGMMGIMRSFNKGYVGFQKRNGLETRWMAIKLTLLIMGLLSACLILLIAQGAFLNWLIKNDGLRNTIMVIRWIIIVALIFYSISFIYRHAPAIQKKWKLVSPGSILATFLSIIVTISFSLFVNNFGRYNALYGSIGTIIVLMSLVFINSLVLLIGYELNVSIHSIKILAEERLEKESIAHVNE
jgi:membrane protein